MKTLAVKGSHDLSIRSLALQLTNNLDQKAFADEADVCLRYCRDNIRYVGDIYNVETLQYPQTTVHLGAGDCDDKSILLASLLSAIGHRVRFVAIAFISDFYSHVWVQDNILGKWLDLEPTEPIDCGQSIPCDGAVDFLTCEL